MQLYVKIQATQCHCTTQVRVKPYGIVAENNLFSFMGGGGGMQQGGGPEDTERALQDSAVGVQSRRGEGQRVSSFSSQILPHIFKAFFSLKTLIF